MPLKVLMTDPDPKPTESAEYLYRYGWQMYTRTEIDFVYRSVDRSGATRRRDPRSELHWPWAEVDYGSEPVRRLCDAEPDSVEVIRRLQPRGGAAAYEQRYRCG